MPGFIEAAGIDSFRKNRSGIDGVEILLCFLKLFLIQRDERLPVYQLKLAPDRR